MVGVCEWESGCAARPEIGKENDSGRVFWLCSDHSAEWESRVSRDESGLVRLCDRCSVPLSGAGVCPECSGLRVFVVHYEMPDGGDTDWETYEYESDARDVFASWLSDRDVLAGAKVSLRRVDGWSADMVETHNETQLERADRGWTCWLWDLAKGGEIVSSGVVK